jgi:putative membrane protein
MKKDYASAAIKGFFIGIANIIPGVSGGTLALVLKVYTRMMNAINNFSFFTIVSCIKALSFRKPHIDAFKNEMKKVDMAFLLILLLGIAAAFVAFSKLMTTLLVSYHEIVYGFFFGLILASIAVPFMEIKRRNIAAYIFIIIGAVLVVLLAVLSPNKSAAQEAVSQTIESYWGRLPVVLLTGILSTSAMILPGISGSFVSLLLGQYFFLLAAVSEANMVVLLTYAVGAVVGLKLLAKAINVLLDKFPDALMSFLTGLVVGSLFVTWPFKQTYISGGDTQYGSNILPVSFGTNEWLTVGAALLGILIVVVVLMLGRNINKADSAGQ